MKFQQKLNGIVAKNNSLLCVGLDPDLDKLPKHLLEKEDPIFEFNKEIIDATFDLVCSYKPNIAFYEAYGIEGLKSLKKTLEYLQEKCPEIPIILDAKRGDIGNTAARYAKAVFEYWNVDAVTVFPHLGKDALEPFLKYDDKLVILLIKTSNPDAGIFQNLQVGDEPYYLKVAKTVKEWNFSNVGLFVGATYPKELADVRALFPDSVFLTAGVGAQGAKTEEAVKAGVDKNGGNFICNNSREIIYASTEKDFTEAARTKALAIRDEINKYR
ncbi:orotidine-5'-phosphate decarboxylase [Candidatus Daviesbacteria bacterium]|nr:orotidine-5'-phosphate decarboxylase [Candidatus Daviesbacteria bacterium]